VVDDDERIVEVFSLLLQRDGYQVLAASDGPSAMELVQQHHPDVAVLDIILPGIDGIEVCRRVKQSQDTKFMPVILVTGLSDRASRLDGLRAGADDFLEKPPDPLELTARVRSLLRTKQLYDEVEAHRRELEQRVAERTKELRAAYERLQALSRVKDNILGIASHELRTPLHQAKIALDLMAQDGIDEDSRQVLFRDAQAAFGQLEYRIRDIQAFSDPTDLRLAPTSLRDILIAAIDQVRSLRRGKEDLIELDAPQDLPPVMVSAASMTRAITHLILNAAKFGEGKPVTVRALEAEGGVRLMIEDKGMGISPDMMEHLFEPLQQGDTSVTRRHGGLGIGLALVKMIFDAHDIAIRIESQEGQGTLVSLVLPIVKL